MIGIAGYKTPSERRFIGFVKKHLIFLEIYKKKYQNSSKIDFLCIYNSKSKTRRTYKKMRIFKPILFFLFPYFLRNSKSFERFSVCSCGHRLHFNMCLHRIVEHEKFPIIIPTIPVIAAAKIQPHNILLKFVLNL